MSSDQIVPLLLGASVALNAVLLLRKPILNLLHREDEVSQDDIMAMVEEGEESGTIETSEKELIENIFEFNNTTAEDVMVHRTEMVILSVRDNHETILNIIRESGRSRFPVYQEDADDIIGTLSTREYLLNATLEHPLSLRELLRPAYFVPESVRADVLFRDMQNKKVHMALVVDEYGGTSGLVTMEDLLEEIVGNIYDEFDPQDEQNIIQQGDNLWKVSGSTDLEELCKAVGLPFHREDALDFDTVGGLIFSNLSVIPQDGSHPVIEAMGMRIRVEELCERRVEWVLVEKLEPSTLPA